MIPIRSSIAELGQRLAGCIGDALHMRPHAAAHVQQKQHIHRHIFAGEIAYGHRAAILAQDEVLGVQVNDGAIAGVYYLRVDPDQRHIAVEHHVVAGRQRSEGQCQDQE